MTNAIETRRNELSQQTKLQINSLLAQYGNNYKPYKLNNITKDVLIQEVIDHESNTIEVVQKGTKTWTCPNCEQETTDYPAICRRDNKTEICSECGEIQAIQDFNASTAKKVEVAKVKETEAVKKNGPVSTEELFDQPLITKEEVKEEKKSKKPKKEATPKPDYRDIFNNIGEELFQLDNKTFANRIPKKSYLKASTGNKNFTYAICLTKEAVRFEIFSKDCDSLQAWHEKLSPRNKSIEYVGAREGFDRCKIQKLVPASTPYTYDFNLVANEFNKFQKLIQPQVNKLK